jgi:hypothetical protein
MQNDEFVEISLSDPPKPSPQVIYEDDFQLYAYENGLWDTDKTPTIDEIIAMRTTFAKYHISAYGYNRNIKYHIKRTDFEQSINHSL